MLAPPLIALPGISPRIVTGRKKLVAASALVLQRWRLAKPATTASFAPFTRRRWRQPDEGRRWRSEDGFDWKGLTCSDRVENATSTLPNPTALLFLLLK
ncbi:hypothetical protein X744_04110 [Mesorhizobium sp. LNJC372A00]|nr:hypothetical protein X745_08085 [Mesorhizobium sp. LNJC374B00]ESY61251.1 hypothetical protein X744_04110 [Mesorhizobium sp. LNJC372A00]